MSEQTRSQAIAADVTALLRARNPLLWIKTDEESRVERYLFEAAAAAGYIPHTWDVAQGPADMAGKVETLDDGDVADVMLREIEKRAGAHEQFLKDIADGNIPADAKFPGERGLWILRDLPIFLDGPVGAPTLRRLRNLARKLPRTPTLSAQAIIVITPSGDVPAELKGHATVIDWPLPDRAEIAATVDALARTYKLKLNGQREAAIDAAIGLNGEEAQSAYAKSIVQTGTIDPVAVANEKRRIIAREGVLEWYEPLPGGLSVVGGLDNLKSWFSLRKIGYSLKARVFGIPRPNGVLLVGVSGCAKSYIAKQLGGDWTCPVLRVDLGALKGSLVGQSEGNLRKALAVIEAVGRCIVWFDEIEKALQGATSGSIDGGVSADALGTILTWMQERKGEAFVVATANDITGLPPEFLRKGRFDDIFFVDLPTPQERVAVLKTTLKKHGREKLAIDASAVTAACTDFTGAEIAAIVPDAMFAAFADGEREIATGDLIAAAKTVVPLIKTAGPKIAALRKWAEQSARPATLSATAVGRPGTVIAPESRVLDVELT